MKKLAIILGIIGAFGLAYTAQATPIGPKPRVVVGTPDSVPDNGTTLLLLGCSLTGLAAIRRWLAS